MDDQRFGPEYNEHEESEIERYLNYTAHFQTVNYPQQFNTNDPWAGWYNSSIDLGEKWEEYYAYLEKLNLPEFYGTNYPVYEEPPPEFDPAQFMPDKPPEEETYPYTPAPEELPSAYPTDISPPGEEEAPVQPTFAEAPSALEPEIKVEVTEEETEDELTTPQALEEKLKEEQVTGEEKQGQPDLTEENTKPAAEAEKEEPVTTSQSVIVWKNFPPK